MIEKSIHFIRLHLVLLVNVLFQHRISMTVDDAVLLQSKYHRPWRAFFKNDWFFSSFRDQQLVRHRPSSSVRSMQYKAKMINNETDADADNEFAVWSDREREKKDVLMITIVCVFDAHTSILWDFEQWIKVWISYKISFFWMTMTHLTWRVNANTQDQTT